MAILIQTDKRQENSFFCSQRAAVAIECSRPTGKAMSHEEEKDLRPRRNRVTNATRQGAARAGYVPSPPLSQENHPMPSPSQERFQSPYTKILKPIREQEHADPQQVSVATPTEGKSSVMNRKIFIILFLTLVSSICLYPPSYGTGRMFLLKPYETISYWDWDEKSQRSVLSERNQPLGIDWSRLLAECIAAGAISGVIATSTQYIKASHRKT